MLAIRHILFPVDFSKRSQATAPLVRTMAARFNAKVTLLSVAPPFWQAAIGDPGAAVMFDMNEIRRDLEDRQSGAFLRELAGVPVDRVAEVGDPAHCITAFAHTHAVDLIMMPTHGYGQFRSMLLGSVTAKVLHDAHCPVWTSTHSLDADAGAHVPGRAILCAVDGTPESVALIVWARHYADATGGNLRVAHALTGLLDWPEAHIGPEFEEELRKQAQQTIEAQIQSTGTEAPLCVGVGEIPAVVREEARRHNADLVVIGRGVLHEKLGRLRTQAYAIIRQSPCPVISV
jgi:nucleotide-binding universal stress UspA family protein